MVSRTSSDSICTNSILSEYKLGEYGVKIVDMNDTWDDSRNGDESKYEFDELADFIELNKDAFLGVTHEN